MFKVIPYHMEKMILYHLAKCRHDHAESLWGLQRSQNKGVDMTNRFTQLYKSICGKKSAQRLSLQLIKNQTTVEVNGGGSSGYTLKNGPRKGQILKHLKTEPKKL